MFRPKASLAYAFAPLGIGMILSSPVGAVGGQPPVKAPLDTEMTIDGVGVACTGIGEAKLQPRWGEYPVRVEFADALHNYMAGETLTLSDAKGEPLFTVSCRGPWLLLKLPDRSPYHVDARLTEKNTSPQSGVIWAPALGQKHFVLTFPKGY